MVRGLLVIVAIWLAWLPLGIVRRVPVWTNNLTLWTATAHDSRKPRAWINLAEARSRVGDDDGAWAALTVADREILDPRRAAEARPAQAMVDLLRIYLLYGRGAFHQARVEARTLLAGAPKWADAQHACEAVAC